MLKQSDADFDYHYIFKNLKEFHGGKVLPLQGKIFFWLYCYPYLSANGVHEL